MKPDGIDDQAASRKKLHEWIAIIGGILIVIFAILTFLYTIGWLKFPKISVNSQDSIELKQIDNKLVFVNFVSMENSRSGMGYVIKMEAQLSHKCDNVLVATFSADSLINKDGLTKFITIGLKEEEPPLEQSYIFYQAGNTISELQPGEIYTLTITYYRLNTIQFLFGDTSTITVQRIFALTESQIKKLIRMNKSHKKNINPVTIALCKI